MTFVPQNRLERSLLRAAHDPACRPQFHSDLLESRVLLAQEGDPPAHRVRTTLEAGSALRLRTWHQNGKDYVPIFTSLARLQSVLDAPAAYLEIDVRSFLTVCRGADLLINPGAECGKELTAEEIARMLEGTIGQPCERRPLMAGTTVRIGAPSKYPTDLVEALRRLFKKHKEVTRAWLVLVQDPVHDEVPHTLITIEATNNRDRVMAAVGMVFDGSTIPDPPVDVHPVSSAAEAARLIPDTIKPFYERKLLGLL